MRTLHRLISPFLALTLLMLTLQASAAACARHDGDGTHVTALASPGASHAQYAAPSLTSEAMPAMEHHAPPGA